MAGRTRYGKDILGVGEGLCRGAASAKAQRREQAKKSEAAVARAGDENPHHGARDGEEVGLVKCCGMALVGLY